MNDFLKNPNRFELRSGLESGAPNCPFGNNYKWIGFDTAKNEYVRLSKSVFKKLIHEFGKNEYVVQDHINYN